MSTLIFASGIQSPVDYKNLLGEKRFYFCLDIVASENAFDNSIVLFGQSQWNHCLDHRFIIWPSLSGWRPLFSPFINMECHNNNNINK